MMNDIAIDESRLPGEAVDAYVNRMALEKAEAAENRAETENSVPLLAPILAADTVVALAGRVFGKPADRNQAREMLKALSGNTHSVYTAVYVCRRNGNRNALLSISKVSFRQLGSAEIDRYLDTGESLDKAGAYAIQGMAAVFISRLEGSFSGVMGLPLFETADLLRRFDIELP